MKRKLVAVIAGTILVFGALAGVTLAQDNTELTFSVPDARAYAAKASVSKEVIEVDRANDPCYPDPTKGNEEETPYDDCDANEYERLQNCGSLAIGESKEISIEPPNPQREEATKQGGAGYDPREPPPLAYPVLLNDISTIGRLTDLFGVRESGGLASRRYVDNSGRSDPRSHTESDGYSVNRSKFEERCSPANANGTFAGSESAYTHLLSRSGQAPNTIHFSKCVGDCKFATDVHERFPASAREATSIIKLSKVDGKLTGELFAQVKGLNFSSGAVTAEEVVSYATFETDGTKDGLEWRVITYSDGTAVCGSPTALKPGSDKDPSSCGDLEIGMASPYVVATERGDKLTIVVPGMVIAWNSEVPLTGEGSDAGSLGEGANLGDATKECPDSPPTYGTENPPQPPNPQDPDSDLSPRCPIVRKQTAHFAGVELLAGVGRAEPFTPSGLFDFGPPIDSFSALGTASFTLPNPPVPPPAPIEGPSRTVAIKQFQASAAPAGALLGAAAAMLLLIVMAWIRRFSWGREVFRIQPFRFFLWFHRAFIRT